MERGFWDELNRPIIGLAPMDGVTDAAFRYMVCRYSAPDLTMTEFTNVEGLARGKIQMLRAFWYHPIERPVVAQIFGVEVESYYKVALVLCALGFDGIDINMGCPVNKIAKKGSGAALIKTPELAKQLVRSTQRACQDWANGITLEEADVHPELIQEARRMKAVIDTLENPTTSTPAERRHIPVSVKTRIGFDRDVSEEWTRHLLETEPANITLHGRTLKQLYTGQADWESIARAAVLTQNTPTTLLGNGDIKSMQQAHEYVEQYGVDGVLIGRATFGNPWFFSDKTPSPQEQLHAALEHTAYLTQNFPDIPFHTIKKHLAWYCNRFPGARKLRSELMMSNGLPQVQALIEDELKGL